jgi:hypothetical protein
MEGIEQVLAVMVLKYSKMLHIGGTIGADEPRTIAKMLIAEYPLNSLDDFNVMFLRGVTGRYGKVMGFDVSVIFGWAMMFQDDWANEREKLIDKPVEIQKPDPIHQPKIDVDKLLTDHLNTLRDAKMSSTPNLTAKQIREEGQAQPPKRKAHAYISDPEKIVMHEKKQQWIAECVEPLGGDKWRLKEGCLSFDEYIRLSDV